MATAYCAAGLFSYYEIESQEVDCRLKTLFIVADSSENKAGINLETILTSAKAEYLGGHVMFWEFPEKINTIPQNYLGSLD